MTVSRIHATKETGPRWKIDKTIPLALVAATAVQLFGFIYWAGRLSMRFENLEEVKERQEEKIESLSRTTLNIERSLGKIESKMELVLERYK